MNSWAQRGVFLLVLILTVFAAAGTSAQQPTFQAATELVSLNVAVVGEKSEPITGLTADRFEVFEDGIQQEVKFFAPGDLPLDVVVLLDTSASMGGSMLLVQQAASRLVNALRPIDRASVMAISSGLRVLQPFTGDFAAVHAAIKGTKAAGRTPLYAALYTALKELAKERRLTTSPRRQAIVVLSDGQDTSSTFTFDELRDAVRRNPVPIYTIAPRPPKTTKLLREQLYGESTITADFELKALASETGGRSFFPVAIHELAGIYDDIASELAHQYSLGYQSTNADRDGGFRKIALRVSVPGAKWRTRAGYVAERVTAALNGH